MHVFTSSLSTAIANLWTLWRAMAIFLKMHDKALNDGCLCVFSLQMRTNNANYSIIEAFNRMFAFRMNFEYQYAEFWFLTIILLVYKSSDFSLANRFEDLSMT